MFDSKEKFVVVLNEKNRNQYIKDPHPKSIFFFDMNGNYNRYAISIKYKDNKEPTKHVCVLPISINHAVTRFPLPGIVKHMNNSIPGAPFKVECKLANIMFTCCNHENLEYVEFDFADEKSLLFNKMGLPGISTKVRLIPGEETTRRQWITTKPDAMWDMHLFFKYQSKTENKSKDEPVKDDKKT